MARQACRSLLLGGLLLAAGWHAAQAQLAGQPCRQDYRLLCADVPQGGGRAIQCLKDHAMQLSPACREALIAARAPAAAPAPAAPPPMAPAAAMGPPPAAAPMPAPVAPEATKAAAGEACRGDIRQYCAGTPQGSGLIGQCLKEHAAQLSPGCRNALVAVRSASPGAAPAAPPVAAAMGPASAAMGPPPAAMGPAPMAAPSASPEAAKAAAGRACRGDIRQYCSGIPQGSGLIGQCLKEHAAQLSPDCRGALVSLRTASPAAAPATPIAPPPPGPPPTPH